MRFEDNIRNGSRTVALFPGRALLTDLIGRAIGLRSTNSEFFEQIHRGLRYASRWDRQPRPLVELQTEKQPNSQSTQKQNSIVYEDGLLTLSIRGSSEQQTSQWALALEQPIHPLFIGHESCLPSAPILRGQLLAKNELQALTSIPLHSRANTKQPLADWPDGLRLPGIFGKKKIVTERRYWKRGARVGRYLRREGRIQLKASP